MGENEVKEDKVGGEEVEGGEKEDSSDYKE